MLFKNLYKKSNKYLSRDYSEHTYCVIFPSCVGYTAPGDYPQKAFVSHSPDQLVNPVTPQADSRRRGKKGKCRMEGVRGGEVGGEGGVVLLMM